MPAGTPRMSMIRSAARYLTEPHPFARRPTTMGSHPVAWGVYANHIGRTSVVVLPFLGFVLTWPMMAAKVIDKTTGV
ncbi:hypothetical protein M011DRAFT_479515 [Sporormia fimetaria CBS 119925]|uniref:Uncharacterized protein n=1 Tax=Sporormia fimetaria CBS 119925 TaxID=1340428 RepID=A0A6A6V604_9PLEO|nr:hypothetical protein M011DRAFT_479515 [Sporormia fimetaria CBS 119925]